MSGNRTSGSIKNMFSTGTLHRFSESRLDEQHIHTILTAPTARFIPLWKNQNLFAMNDPLQPAFLSKEETDRLLNEGAEFVFLGMLEEIPYFAFALPDTIVTEELFGDSRAFKDLRETGALLGQEEGNLLAYARAMIHWHRTHQYCGRCGNKTISIEAGHVRQCTNPACDLKHFPRTDSAIIVRITYQDRCLLVRQPIWPEGMYATVAGFLEPGESLEDAVAREVKEETGLTLTNIKYHSSQPWPFPASIMVGFTAEATSMEYTLDQREIEKACWLTRQELIEKIKDKSIKLPRPVSISYRLIDDWFRKKNKGKLSQIK
ncbi:NAD(+) diphosphatase [Cytophagaceae bacterium DM2B3-1]|uniref:NAD(+) diphosphatase n=1 Tax=Xanthocytophaga flava TaxID=3048013 RepID=A0ABT7CFP4_9BACT|nr:NAD(+) diphosphatase [Xanthocytophaga flavus]MDJ1491810.1 NAD(+) diphosphatase [Xanthocytophaga flavus]